MSPQSPIVRNANVHDVNHILRLNEAAVEVTSPMDEGRYSSIAKQASLDIVTEIEGRVVGFLLALRNGAKYDNDNYGWFCQRYSDLIYIDRVIVDEGHQGCGIGQGFYSHVVDWSSDRRIGKIACEIDMEPPNASSLRFHEKLGFEEVGTRQLPSGKKVSMRIKNL